MHRFYLPPEQCHEPTLMLSDREAHHALHVLRLRRGERVGVLDGAGHEFQCEVRDCDRSTAQLGVLQKNFSPPLPYQVTLLQAVPKGKLIEFIIEKATELGAFRIVPIHSERMTTQLDDETAPQKVQKWRTVAIEAIKQCGSPWLPQIERPLPLKQFLARKEKFELPLIASLQSDRRHPRECFREFKAKQDRLPTSLCVWVGPEGDFTPAEVSAIKAQGALPVTLGPLVLRSETAAVYCLSVLNYELQAASQNL
jgi:16S rRNA (uracil1498-N3)-methyltransferase